MSQNFLELDQVFCGPLSHCSVDKSGIRIRCSSGMHRTFFEWIQTALNGVDARKSGSIIVTDFNFNVQQRWDFTQAKIEEIVFPALDATKKEPANLEVLLNSSNQLKTFKTGEAKLGPLPLKKLEQWLVTNFRVEIAGLDTSRVSRVDSLKFVYRDHWELPDLVIELPAIRADPFVAWHQKFVSQGSHSQVEEKRGELTYLNAGLDRAFFQLSFTRLGIYKIENLGAPHSGDSLQKVKVTMYVEDTRLTLWQTRSTDPFANNGLVTKADRRSSTDGYWLSCNRITLPNQ